ncbi:gustatory receptor 30 [Tribolium castaneum]|uniref:Gustatory receptor 30 n=1 Tax=Tribolium castaneum TaxID=7070 RepID=D6WG06_TRICA|nr:gustatory receptor 30 [Tribolium castaneum]
MLLSRYRFVKRLLMEGRGIQVLRKCAYNLFVLKETTDIFNEIFGWPVLFLVLYTSLKLLYYFESAINDVVRVKTELIIVDISLIFIYVIGTFVIFVKCDDVLKEAEEIFYLLQKIKAKNKKLQDVIVTNVYVLPKFSAAKFFSLEKATIFKMLSSLITFVLVIFQLKFLMWDVFDEAHHRK